MYRYILEDKRHVLPFNQPASELTIGTQVLRLFHEELFASAFQGKIELGNTLEYRQYREQLPAITPDQPAIVYRDSLWFDHEFLAYFLERAQNSGRACRAAIPPDDKAYNSYTLPLSNSFDKGTDEDGNPVYLVDLWYFPEGYTDEQLAVTVPSGWQEKGFYSVPEFMAQNRGDLTHYLPERAMVSVESWVHIYYASVIFGVFTKGSRFEEYIKKHNFFALRLLWRAIIEQKQILTTSKVVVVGKDTIIDPSAIINGPTVIGNNCVIGPGVVIDNCQIGDNVNISQGCQLMLSTVGNHCFLPFRANLFMTSMMEETIVAQNTCLQMCVIGRNSFVGAGSTFTDFNLVGEGDGHGNEIPRPIKATDINGNIGNAGQVVLGSAIGHNCRIGAGMVVFPGRMIESDVILVASPQRRVVSRNITWEESDHHAFNIPGMMHKRKYPRRDEEEENAAENWSAW
jgi:carbonic anhydrase/acetyltransferase-like protein (isoleucine patch superfamily)